MVPRGWLGEVKAFRGLYRRTRHLWRVSFHPRYLPLPEERALRCSGAGWWGRAGGERFLSGPPGASAWLAIFRARRPTASYLIFVLFGRFCRAGCCRNAPRKKADFVSQGLARWGRGPGSAGTGALGPSWSHASWSAPCAGPRLPGEYGRGRKGIRCSESS